MRVYGGDGNEVRLMGWVGERKGWEWGGEVTSLGATCLALCPEVKTSVEADTKSSHLILNIAWCVVALLNAVVMPSLTST